VELPPVADHREDYFPCQPSSLTYHAARFICSVVTGHTRWEGALEQHGNMLTCWHRSTKELEA